MIQLRNLLFAFPLVLIAAIGADAQSTQRRPQTCEDVKAYSDRSEVVRAEESRTIPAASVATLELRPARNGGATVYGWDRNEYAITICKSAWSEIRAESDALLRQIVLNVVAGRVEVRGPDSGRWTAHLIVQAPRAAAIDVETSNGPLALTDLAGTIAARTHNGPISLRNVSGQVRADAENGPISVEGNRGNHRLTAQNGPISVRLDAERWEGGQLDAETRNGPVTLRLPENFRSGVRVDASRHSPVRCRASQCGQVPRNFDFPNRIEFGAAPFVVRVATVNGPVSIDGR